MALIGSVNGIPVTKGGGDVATNTGVGTSTLVSNTNGNNNSALGYQALDSCTSGYENVAVGSNAAAGITSGFRNTIIGNNAGASLTTGNNNTIIGGNGTSGGAGESMTTGSRNTIIGGFTGNQNELDIRTASNRIVLSGGDGNPRFYMSHDGVTRLFCADYYTVTNNTKGGTVTVLPRDVFFPPSYFNVLDTCTIIVNATSSEGTSGGYLRTDILHVNYRFGYNVATLAGDGQNGMSMTTWSYSFTSDGLRVTQNWGASGSNLGTRWSFFITGCLVQG